MTTSAPRGPLAPPEEQFWQRYSPHHEFSLSSAGSIAVHIGMFVVFIFAMWLLAEYAVKQSTPVPIRTLTVADDNGNGNGVPGQGGPQQNLVDPLPPEKAKDLPPDIKLILPSIPPLAGEGLRPDQLPTVRDLPKIAKGTRDQLPGGKDGKGGAGPGPGSGAARALRWELIFRTADGNDYLSQLAVMKATIAIPSPPDWQRYKVFKDLSRPAAEPFKREELPALFFIDGDADSAGRLAKALGLDYTPPNFIAFFPKEIEEELAAKERAFGNLRESEVFSTKFKILVRDGKPTITVVEQIPIKR
jgi:hypothetical protein